MLLGHKALLKFSSKMRKVSWLPELCLRLRGHVRLRFPRVVSQQCFFLLLGVFATSRASLTPTQVRHQPGNQQVRGRQALLFTDTSPVAN